MKVYFGTICTALYPLHRSALFATRQRNKYHEVPTVLTVKEAFQLTIIATYNQK
jgi:hypothetical protein